MMLYQPKGRKNWMSGWKGRDKQWVRVSLQTSSKKRAQEYAAMLEVLADDHQWEALDLLRSGQVDFPQVLAAYRNGALARLKQEVRVADIVPLIEAFNAEAGPRGSYTRKLYVGRLRAIFPEGQRFPSTDFTTEWVQDYIDRLVAEGAKNATVYNYASTLKLFADFLVRRKVLAENPAEKRKLRFPKAPKPRDKHLTSEEVQRVMDTCTEEMDRVAYALAYGAGLEIGVIVKLRRQDFDVRAKEVRARGTKTHTRDRVARVANWAWPIVERYIATMLPSAWLFEAMPGATDARKADLLSRRHRKHLASIGLTGFTFHDARHHWAVRAVKAGAPLQVVAQQLGHADVTMVSKVYGVYAPTAAERDYWENFITEQEKARRAAGQ